jgi:hypothetical protein
VILRISGRIPGNDVSVLRDLLEQEGSVAAIDQGHRSRGPRGRETPGTLRIKMEMNPETAPCVSVSGLREKEKHIEADRSWNR